MVQDLPIEKLRRTCDPSILCCESSAELSPLSTIIGQERAVRALKFGLGIKERGFNIYVAGRPGTGRTTAVESFLEEVAKGEPTPSDWCYVNHFRDSSRPNAIQLPSGRGDEGRYGSLVDSPVREFQTPSERRVCAAGKRSDLPAAKTGHLEPDQRAGQCGFVISPRRSVC
jgi:hypothetical protein